ncbi:hypothetical protein E4L96_19655 [Massilia arenosa]|uniref:Uncharacterized protein n=1 Tax=Zemynaea arenosa TaxID=2561931 RepID=A0A4Y9S1R5_9BURK|nr:hypothetical protein [Massilia arenosa]TFW13478.1 hypothetical protein E4L96_19655 [Massilia arenosa]
MLPALVQERPPRLVRAIKTLAGREVDDEGIILADELSGITAMVAEKFTNDRTADGIQRALFLTVGGVSLGLEHLFGTADDEAVLDFLIEEGAEAAFQQGFKLLKDLAAMPEDTLIGEYDTDTVYSQRRLKEIFFDICYADPQQNWSGYEKYMQQHQQRAEVQAIVRAAQWLRRHHWEGPINDPDLNAEGVLALAVIFAVEGTGRITARTNDAEFARFVAAVRKQKPDFEEGWSKLLDAVPPQHRAVIAERIENYRQHCTVLQKLPGRSALKTLLAELETYAGSELEADI